MSSTSSAGGMVRTSSDLSLDSVDDVNKIDWRKELYLLLPTVNLSKEHHPGAHRTISAWENEQTLVTSMIAIKMACLDVQVPSTI